MATTPPAATRLHHAAVRADWDARAGDRYKPAGFADEGFVHLSSPEQLIGTLHKHYPGRADLILLTIDPERVSAELLWEDLYGSGIEFPHLYGPIELAAVTEVVPLPCDENGRFDWWRPDEAVVVHRAGRSAVAIHGLFDHLRDNGFVGCPEPRWRRDGLEAVTHLPGRSMSYPLPDWFRSPEPLEALGAMVRAAHDASEGFEPDGPWAAGHIEMRPGWAVTHGDLGPENTLWEDGAPVGLIDWEFAEPGPPEYDVVAAAINLCGHVDRSKHERAGLVGCDIDARLDAFASGYGRWSAAEIKAFAPDALHQQLLDYRARVEDGLARWLELEESNVGERLGAQLAFLRESASSLDG